KKSGRRLVLATAANERIAYAVARHLGLFDHVISSDESANLKGTAKLQAIRKIVGDDFGYAADSSADLPLWCHARTAILVNCSTRLRQKIPKRVRIEAEFGEPVTDVAVWLKAIRAHQWLKNLLLFVPLLTAFSIG